MSSSIDATKPTAGSATTASVRTQFATAETELNELMRATEDSVTATGTADVLVADFTNNVVLAEGVTVCVKAAYANANIVPTINVDSTGVRNITKDNGAVLKAGDISGAGHYMLLRYNSTDSEWVLLNPAKVLTNNSNTKDAAYTFVLSDANKVVLHTEGTARAWTIPPESSIAYLDGTKIDLVNFSTGDITITRGTGVKLYLLGGTGAAASDANVTLDGGSQCTLWKQVTNTWFVYGNGLS